MSPKTDAQLHLFVFEQQMVDENNQNTYAISWKRPDGPEWFGDGVEEHLYDSLNNYCCKKSPKYVTQNVFVRTHA